eukprot:TRINITY_DN5936_c0_g1_i1.p1 TRINITY_DN5936_c0_g1~~TRINITY_DN5936_c0_g1_i1.p1  ORF type:complete len:394 (+),score=56.81 TRINITY_DN5936_c0_g1_i1:56-1183(+)
MASLTVSSVSPKATLNDLLDYFKKFGQVRSCTFTSGDARARSALVMFAERDDAEIAVRMSAHGIAGSPDAKVVLTQPLRQQFKQQRKQRSPSRSRSRSQSRSRSRSRSRSLSPGWRSNQRKRQQQRKRSRSRSPVRSRSRSRSRSLFGSSSRSRSRSVSKSRSRSPPRSPKREANHVASASPREISSSPEFCPDTLPAFFSGLPSGMTAEMIRDQIDKQLECVQRELLSKLRQQDAATPESQALWQCDEVQLQEDGSACAHLRPSTTMSQVVRMRDFPLLCQLLDGSLVYGAVVKVTSQQEANADAAVGETVVFPVSSTLMKLAPLAPGDSVWGEPGVQVHNVELCVRVHGTRDEITSFTSRVQRALDSGFLDQQ